MGSSDAAVLQAREGEDFDSITLATSGTDVNAIAEEIAKAIGASGEGDTDAKAKAEAEAKAKADAETKAKEEAEAKAKAETDAKAKADAAAAAAGRTEVKVDGILAKDGKNVIPFAALEAERERAKSEKQGREAAEQRVKELTEQVEKAKAKAADDPSRAEGEIADVKAKIAALKDTLPEIGDVLGPIVSQMESIATSIADVRSDAAKRDAQVKSEAEREVQDAIDRNPKLVFVQAKDQELWNRIVDQDVLLRQNPKMAHLSFDQRFEKAIAAVEAVHGVIELPSEFQPKGDKDAAAKQAAEKAAKDKADAEAKAKADADAKAKAGLSAKDAQAQAKAELEKAAAAKAAVTLSDIAGGLTPETNDRSADKLSPDEIATQVGTFLDKGGRIQDIPGLFAIG